MNNHEFPRADVLRIVRRDFPVGRFNVICNVLASYGVLTKHREVDRVRLAVLKLADKDESRLRTVIGDARRDYRNVLLAAEYPEFAANRSRLEDFTLDRKTEINTADRDQYLKWLDEPVANLTSREQQLSNQ